VSSSSHREPVGGDSAAADGRGDVSTDTSGTLMPVQPQSLPDVRSGGGVRTAVRSLLPGRSKAGLQQRLASGPPAIWERDDDALPAPAAQPSEAAASGGLPAPVGPRTDVVVAAAQPPRTATPPAPPRPTTRPTRTVVLATVCGVVLLSVPFLVIGAGPSDKPHRNPDVNVAEADPTELGPSSASPLSPSPSESRSASPSPSPSHSTSRAPSPSAPPSSSPSHAKKPVTSHAAGAARQSGKAAGSHAPTATLAFRPATAIISGVTNNKCVDVDTNTPISGNKVQLWDCNGVPGQQWSAGTDGTLRSFGKCLNIVGNATANFSPVELRDCNGTGGQQWVSRTDGSLYNPQSGRCLDDPQRVIDNGTQLQIYDCNRLATQVWRFF
jgi:hypothetical protein